MSELAGLLMGMVQYNHIGDFSIGSVCKNMTTTSGSPYNRLRKFVNLFPVFPGIISRMFFLFGSTVAFIIEQFMSGIGSCGKLH